MLLQDAGHLTLEKHESEIEMMITKTLTFQRDLNLSKPTERKEGLFLQELRI